MERGEAPRVVDRDRAPAMAPPDHAAVAVRRALRDSTRLRILRRLAAPGGATVSAMSADLDLDRSTVAGHITSLRRTGLVLPLAGGGYGIERGSSALRRLLKELVGLEMRPRCERCGAALASGSVAYICSYECTFCAVCARRHGQDCPNCGGELVRRPRRRPAPRSAP